MYQVLAASQNSRHQERKREGKWTLLVHRVTAVCFIKQTQYGIFKLLQTITSTELSTNILALGLGLFKAQAPQKFVSKTQIIAYFTHFSALECVSLCKQKNNPQPLSQLGRGQNQTSSRPLVPRGSIFIHSFIHLFTHIQYFPQVGAYDNNTTNWQEYLYTGFLPSCRNQIQGLFKDFQGPYEGYIKRTKANRHFYEQKQAKRPPQKIFLFTTTTTTTTTTSDKNTFTGDITCPMRLLPVYSEDVCYTFLLF